MSNSKKALSPATSYKSISKAVYMTGSPRNYRFDGQNGIFYSPNKEESLGDSIEMKVILHSAFVAPPMFMGEESYSGRPFIELFFLNNKGHMCSILLHSQSARSLQKLSVDMFYDDVSFSDVILVLSANKLTSSDGKFTFYAVEFSTKKIEAQQVKEDTEKIESIMAGIDNVFNTYTMGMNNVSLGELPARGDTVDNEGSEVIES